MSDFVYLTLPAPWATEADLRDEVERLRAQVEQLTGCLERCSEIRRQNDTRLTRERDAWKGAHAGAVRALKAMRAELRETQYERGAWRYERERARRMAREALSPTASYKQLRRVLERIEAGG